MVEPMQFVMTGSRNLYPWIPAAIHSLIEHNPNVKLWYFAEDDELPYKLPEQVEIVNVSGQTIFNADNCANWNTEYTYLSLIRSCYPLLFTGKPNGYGIRTLPHIDKIIQLDCDLVVLGDLRPVYDIDMGDAYFAMVDEVTGAYFPFGQKNADGTRKRYGNCAVCLFSLDNMRKDKIAEEEIEFLKTTQIQCIDQDAHMYICEKHGYDRWLNLAGRYNETLVTSMSLRPIIWHYCGQKNWWRDFDDLYRGQYMQQYSKYFEVEACARAGIKF